MVGMPVSRPAPRGMSVASLVLGIVSVLLVIIFVATTGGFLPLIGAALLAGSAVIIGIIALVKRQPKAMAIAGLVTGALVFLFSLGLMVFALLFVGALVIGGP